MTGKVERLAITVLVATYTNLTLGQVPPPIILEIEVENRVSYNEDVSDVSKFATDPGVTTAIPIRNFRQSVGIGDIVAVNGQPAKGTFINNIRQLVLTPEPNPGQAIADITRGSIIEFRWEILKTDGTPVGTIIAAGLGAGPPVPGAPLASTQANVAIVGGTGAFLGARGQQGQARAAQTGPESRTASMSEDPANRRKHGGSGGSRFLLHLVPLARPEVMITSSGPAITHSTDFSLVTASKPAAAGEILSLFATGLGPTRPGVDPGRPFPSSPLVVVNSPVEVMLNGRSAEVLAAVGFPGAVDVYQVNFRVPPDTTTGMATVQVSAAWISGPGVSIRVQ